MNWLKSRLVDDWRNCLRWSSVRLHAAVLLLVAVYEIMPVLSPEIAGMLPQHIQASAIGIYAIAGLALRLTKAKSNGAG